MLGLHEASGETQLNKFAIFCAANTNMPYVYKRKVFDAAVTTSLFYSSETWLVTHPKKFIVLYNRAIKCLLGVRIFTSPDLCMIESGILPVQAVITSRRRKFLEKRMRAPDDEEPFHAVFRLCEAANTQGYRFLAQALRNDGDVRPMDQVARRIREKPVTASKYVAYRTSINLWYIQYMYVKTSSLIMSAKPSADYV